MEEDDIPEVGEGDARADNCRGEDEPEEKRFRAESEEVHEPEAKRARVMKIGVEPAVLSQLIAEVGHLEGAWKVRGNWDFDEQMHHRDTPHCTTSVVPEHHHQTTSDFQYEIV